MESGIIRNMQFNYLTIKDECYTPCNFQRRMIQHNLINGLLRMEEECLNGNTHIKYEITGLLSLSDSMGRGNYNKKQVITVIQSVLDVMRLLPEYLLHGDDIILDPDYIYIDETTGTAKLCYFPGYHSSLKTQLTHLFDYFMNEVNYKDKEAVYFIYSIYMKSKEIDCTLLSLTQMVQEHESVSLQESSFIAPENTIEIKHVTKYENIEKEEKRAEEFEQKMILGVIAAGVTVLIFSTCAVLGLLQTGITNEVSWFRVVFCFIVSMVIGLGTFVGLYYRHQKNDVDTVIAATVEKKEETIANLPVQESVQKTTDEKKNYPVVLETHLLSLFPQEYESIHFPSFPCYIGSAKEKVTVYVSNPGISLYHVKINRKGKDYYLTDLASARGTKINDIKVKPEIEYKLSDEDKITMGNNRYCFRYSVLQDSVLEEYNND